MGYKLAGYELIGNCEIDPRMMRIYCANHHPQYPFLMDIRDFIKFNDKPEVLYDLDVLDGSPPCSVFSTAGNRDADWGKEKAFREGQKKQRLDDLFFSFIELAKQLQPKVVIAENVVGLVQTRARGYVNEIIKGFDDAGYCVQMFMLDSSTMGVPQIRKRVFFICHRKDLAYKKLLLNFNEPGIKFKNVRSVNGVKGQGVYDRLLEKRQPSDRDMGDLTLRIRGKPSGFTSPMIHEDEWCRTIMANGMFFRYVDGLRFSRDDFVNVQTFPQDYDFGAESPQYVCGMSVPPVMMAQIASQVYEQWFDCEGAPHAD